jgi:hypothetical protein
MPARVSKAEWMAERLTGERARGVYSHMSGVNQLPRYNKATMDPFGPHGKIAKQTAALDKQLAERTKEVDRMIADKAPKGSTIHSTVPSTCLAKLSWRDNVAYFSFYRGGSIDYSEPMSKSDFLDWVESDEGIGKFGNAFVFD